MNDALAEVLARQVLEGPARHLAVQTFLMHWCQDAPRPLVLLLDEVDALIGDTLISLLRQLRGGYHQRPANFPHTVVLCGVRDLRDYRIHARSEREPITGGSTFNIKAESLRLGDFTATETSTLLLEHTAETGQVFTPEAQARVWDLTQGQPWLVNALAYHACFRMPAGRDGAGGLVVANPIYREVLPRALASGPQDSLPHISPTWLNPDGSLNPERLLEACLAFWRHHGQPLLASDPYHEIAPHLVLMAFLHRVVNGFSSPPPVGEGPGERAGTLEREYAIGSGRMDLCLRYRDLTLGMELKVWRDGAPDPLAEGLEQLDGYLAGLGLDRGWLVIFDRRTGQPPIAERTASHTATSPQGRAIQVVRA